MDNKLPKLTVIFIFIVNSITILMLYDSAFAEKILTGTYCQPISIPQKIIGQWHISSYNNSDELANKSNSYTFCLKSTKALQIRLISIQENCLSLINNNIDNNELIEKVCSNNDSVQSKILKILKPGQYTIKASSQAEKINGNFILSLKESNQPWLEIVKQSISQKYLNSININESLSKSSDKEINYLKTKNQELINYLPTVFDGRQNRDIFAVNNKTNGLGLTHLIYGTFKNRDGTIPKNESLTFNAFITKRPNEKLTQSDHGCGYNDGNWWVEAGNFETPWSLNDVLFLSFIDKSSQEAQSIYITLNLAGNQNFSLPIITPLADAGLDQTVRKRRNVLLSASNSYVSGDNNPQFSWKQTEGFPLLNLATPNNVTTLFRASHIGAFKFEVRVTSNGVATTDSCLVHVKEPDDDNEACFINSLSFQ